MRYIRLIRSYGYIRYYHRWIAREGDSLDFCFTKYSTVDIASIVCTIHGTVYNLVGSQWFMNILPTQAGAAPAVRQPLLAGFGRRFRTHSLLVGFSSNQDFP